MNPELEEEVFDAEGLDTGLWKKILRLVAQSKKNLYRALAFITVEAMIGVALPVLNRHAIDVFFVGIGTNKDIFLFALGYGFLVVLQAFVIYKFIFYSGKVEMEVAYFTRQSIMEKLQNLSFSFFDKTPSGWVMARLTSDVARLSEILSWSLVDLVWGFAMMVTLTVVMLVINWKLALVVLVVVPFVYAVSAWFQKRILINYRKSRAVNSKITSAFSEGISGAKTTKTMALESMHYGEFQVLTSEMKARTMRAIILNSLYVPIVIVLSSVGNAGVIWAGGSMVMSGQSRLVL